LPLASRFSASQPLSFSASCFLLLASCFLPLASCFSPLASQPLSFSLLSPWANSPTSCITIYIYLISCSTLRMSGSGDVGRFMMPRRRPCGELTSAQCRASFRMRAVNWMGSLNSKPGAARSGRGASLGRSLTNTTSAKPKNPSDGASFLSVFQLIGIVEPLLRLTDTEPLNFFASRLAGLSRLCPRDDFIVFSPGIS